MKYSILIPAYKAKFLKECIDSILSQTFKDFELVILNDCSPEPVDEIIKSYQSAIDKGFIKYYRNETNVGVINVVDNWNKLLSFAEGEFVVCMGDDDKIAPIFLEAYNGLIERYPSLDVYHARTEIIDEQSEFLNLQEDRPDRESVYAMMWNCMYKKRLQFIGDFLFRASTLRSKGGFYKLPMAWGSDFLSILTVAADKGFANLHEPTFFYRSSRYSITTSGDEHYKIKAISKMYDWEQDFLSKPVENSMDQKYQSLLLSGLPALRRKSILFSVAEDICGEPLRKSLYWLRNRKEIKFRLRDVLLSLVLAVYMKFKKQII